MNICISFTLGDLATSVPLMEAIMHDKVYIYIRERKREREREREREDNFKTDVFPSLWGI